MEPDPDISAVIDEAMAPVRLIGDDVKLRKLATQMTNYVVTTLAVDDEQAVGLLGGINPDEITAGYGTLPNELMIRLTILNGIVERLSANIGGSGVSLDWLRKKNAFLNYKRPLDLMIGGRIDSLVEIRRHIAP